MPDIERKPKAEGELSLESLSGDHLSPLEISTTELCELADKEALHVYEVPDETGLGCVELHLRREINLTPEPVSEPAETHASHHRTLSEELALDRERDENDGLLDSGTKKLQQNLSALARELQAGNEQLDTAKTRKQRKRGAAVDTRLKHLEGVLSPGEMDKLEDLMESAARSASSGFLQSKELIDNLIERIADALKGSFPLELYVGTELKKAKDDLRRASIHRLNFISRLVAESFGEEGPLAISALKAGVAHKLELLVKSYESELARLASDPGLARQLLRHDQDSKSREQPGQSRDRRRGRSQVSRLIRLQERGLARGKMPGRIEERLDNNARGMVQADLERLRVEIELLPAERSSEAQRDANRKKDANLKEYLDNLARRIRQERERHENAGFLEPPPKPQQPLQTRQAQAEKKRDRSSPQTQLIFGPFKQRRARRGLYSALLDEGELLGNEREALISLLEAMSRGAVPSQASKDALANLAIQILETLKGRCPLDLFVGCDTDRIQSTFREVARQRLRYFSKLLEKHCPEHRKVLLSSLQSALDEAIDPVARSYSGAGRK